MMRDITAIFAIAFLSISSHSWAQSGDRNSNPSGGENSTLTLCDAKCVRVNAERAASACASRVEDEAPGDYEWLQRPFGGIFKEADVGKAEAPTVARYRGDSVRFLSPQREWVRAVYECGYDTSKQSVNYVRIHFGVLGKPSAVPAMPTQARLTRPAQPKSPGPQLQASAAPDAQAAAAPTSDRRRVGEIDEVSVVQIKPSSVVQIKPSSVVQ